MPEHEEACDHFPEGLYPWFYQRAKGLGSPTGDCDQLEDSCETGRLNGARPEKWFKGVPMFQDGARVGHKGCG